MLMKLLPALAAATRALDRLCAFLAFAALTAIAAVVMLQVTSRFLLTSAPAWTEEASRYLFMYMVAVSAGLVMRKGLFVSLELFQHGLGPTGRALYRLLVCTTVGGFCLYMLPYSWEFAMVGQWQTSPTLLIPMHYIFSSVFILFGLVALYSLVGFLETVVALISGGKH